MTPGQSLRMVEVPLAMQVIMAGVRTAAVWVIGTATLSTPIGQTSLGNYIFAGLQTQNWVLVLFGCVAAAALALVVDQLLAVLERGLAARSRALTASAAAGLLLIVLAALLPTATRAGGGYAIGAKPFGEQYILAALMEDRLRARGLAASRRDGLGSAVILDALAAGDIDAYVEYTGTIWANQMRRTDVLPRAEVLREVADWLKARHGIVTLGGLGFENAYALAMRRERAQQLGIRSIADLARHAPSLSIAGDYEFFERPEWKAIRDAYGLSFGRERQMQAEFMYPAVAGGEVDVISAYSSDGRIDQLDLVVLDDPRQAIPPYDAILLVSPRRAGDKAFLDALRPLVGAVDVKTMREANRRAGDGATPEAVARWLEGQIGK
jgi:osmoprotectant transport system permease protein